MVQNMETVADSIVDGAGICLYAMNLVLCPDPDLTPGIAEEGHVDINDIYALHLRTR